jgi:hypothetical protein
MLMAEVEFIKTCQSIKLFSLIVLLTLEMDEQIFVSGAAHLTL